MTPDDHAFLSLVLVWLVALFVALVVEKALSKLPRPKRPRWKQ